MEVSVLGIVGYFFILCLGVLAHFFKKKIKGETFADIKSYFKNNFKTTVTTVIAAIVLFIGLIYSGGLSILGVFTAGYACDSAFNKDK